MDYLVNEPLPAASISEDNARGWEKETFKYEIIILRLIFYISNILGEKKRNKETRGERACERRKQALWLVDFFIDTVIEPGLDRLSCQMNSRDTPFDKN